MATIREIHYTKRRTPANPNGARSHMFYIINHLDFVFFSARMQVEQVFPKL